MVKPPHILCFHGLKINGLDRLHRPAYCVTFNIKNTGSFYGGEVRILFYFTSATVCSIPKTSSRLLSYT